jgi:hypothetical protein
MRRYFIKQLHSNTRSAVCVHLLIISPVVIMHSVASVQLMRLVWFAVSFGQFHDLPFIYGMCGFFVLKMMTD